jgi:tetratricopeptide (TPR) repeat protein
MTDDACKPRGQEPGAQREAEESTQEVDLEDLRGVGGLVDLAPASVTRMETPASPFDPRELDAMPESVPVIVEEMDENIVDPADVEDVEDDDEELRTENGAVIPREPFDELPFHEQPDPGPEVKVTMPGDDVAEALRAMMGELPEYREPSYADPDPPSIAEVTPRFARPLQHTIVDESNLATRDDAPLDDEPVSVAEITPSFPVSAKDLAASMPLWNEASRSLDDGDTQTRLPDEIVEEAPSEPRPEEALPSFALEDDPLEDDAPSDDRTHAWQGWKGGADSARAGAPPAKLAIDHDSTSITQASTGNLAATSLGSVPSHGITAHGAPASAATVVASTEQPPPTEARGETTAQFNLPIPSAARRSYCDSADYDSAEVPRASSAEVDTAATGHAHVRSGAIDAALRSERATRSFDDDLGGSRSAPESELPRFTLASVPDVKEPSSADAADPTPAWTMRSWRPQDGWAEAVTFAGVTARTEPPSASPHESDAELAPPPAMAHDTQAAAAAEAVPTSDGSVDVPISVGSIEAPGPEPAHEETTAVGASPATALADESGEALDDAEIEEIVPEQIVEEASASTGSTTKPPPFKPPTARPPPALDKPDEEEAELLAEKKYGALIALYRQRLAQTESSNKKASWLLKIASVYETYLEDKNEAFQMLVEAFELAPLNEDVVAAVDRVGKETGRIGELADKVKKRLLPGAPDDKRVAYLGHLVFWYERVLGRGNEVSSLVSEIERQDKVHPLVLKRAAQIAAMNSDAKTQREHLLRALERTIRREEKVDLHLALANAYAGTPDALKHYQLALEFDPASLVALQGIKRLGKEKEQHSQVQWALERIAEVAPTEAERIDALLELAELQETKFLKRELAAELLERVLEIEPSQPQALKMLERCYHALRDWPKLGRILGIRAEHTFDKKAKVELYELAAEVYESKMGDLPGAVDVYLRLLDVDPKHKRALGDLARLYEKLGDWANLATYKARLAELAPTKRASSQELVKLGDLLNSPDRDPLAAKLQYERAVEVDPTNAAAWEALQRIAAAEGDEQRVIECLEQRKKHTDVPRQRAAVLVELANVHLAAGDEESARKCFEAAIRADSSNEAAAIHMLDAYTAEKRWMEAAPLCELLVHAAIRDRDGEALFVRLRLATRIAAALGDADRAVTSAIAALDARPADPGAQADLIAVCAQSPASIDRARELLTRIAEAPDALAPDVVARLAALLRDAGDLDNAALTYERARHLDPVNRDLAKELAEVYLAQGDYPRACKLKVDMARSAASIDERFALLVDAGEIWARRAEELEKAASVFEEARAIKPMDPWLLQTLMWLYGELGQWQQLTGVLEAIVEVQEKTEDKIETLQAMADVVRNRLGDRVRAADIYDQILDLDKKRLDVFEELVRTLTEEKDWERLERSYRKMIARVKDDDEPQLQFLLFHQLGLIYRDRLGDASRAYDALDAASRLRPDDAEVRKIVVELLVVTDNLDNAVARLRAAIERDPHDAELYAELYELFLRQHAFDKAWCVVNVLSRMREPTAEQRRFHEDYAPMPLDRVPGQIVEMAWRSHIFHADLEPALTSLFALMTPAVARLRFSQLRPEQRVGRPFTPTHSRMHDAIRLTFTNAAEILNLPAPELLLGDPKGNTPFSPALAPFGSILVCVPQVETQARSLVYMVGKRLAEQRPELSARAFFPSVPDLTSLLGTAVRVSRNEVAKEPNTAALDASFAAILTPQERDGMRSIVEQATSEGAPLDVKKWSICADLSSMRAGLLLCGDVEPARLSIEADATPTDMPVRDRIGELYKFAVSDLYADLRGAIGVAVQA